MHLNFRSPENVSWTLDGASFATDIRLDNGKPQQATVVTWDPGLTPGTGQYIDIRATWASPLPLWCASLLRLSCPAGTKVDVTGRRPEDGGFTFDLGGNSTTQRTVSVPGRGSEHIVLPSSHPTLIGLQWRIYNDAAGVTWVNSPTDFRIGEARGWEGRSLPHVLTDPKRSRTQNRIERRALDGTPHIVSRDNWRDLTFSLDVAESRDVYQRGLIGEDWESIEHHLDSAAGRVLCIPRLYGEGGEIDWNQVHRQAVFGLVKFGDFTHAGQLYVRGTLSVSEVP